MACVIIPHFLALPPMVREAPTPDAHLTLPRETAGLPALHPFPPCTSTIHLMVDLPSLVYLWNLNYAHCP